MKPNIVLVCGGRDYDDSAHIHRKLTKLHHKRPIDILIHGGATGADGYAGAWTRCTLGVQEVSCPAHWKKYPSKMVKAVGPMRNRAMLLLRPNLVVAFPGGTGTADMVKIAKAAGIKVKLIKAREPKMVGKTKVYK